MADAVTPTQQWHQGTEGVDDLEATWASDVLPWGPHSHMLTTSTGLTHWFKNSEGTWTHPCLPHAYLCRESSISVGESWPKRSMLTPHHREITLYYQAARIYASQHLADKAFILQIKTPRPCGLSLRADHSQRTRGVTSWGPSPAEPGHGATLSGCQSGDH